MPLADPDLKPGIGGGGGGGGYKPKMVNCYR